MLPMPSSQTAKGLGRRAFLQRGAGAAAGVALASRLDLLSARAAGAATPGRATGGLVAQAGAGYGALAPVKDQATGLELLMLPRGFEYFSYGWTGDPMSDGGPAPSNHDGMAAFLGDDGKVRLVRNHERGGTSGAFATGMTYDPMAEGGTTTLVFDPEAGQFLESRPSVAGTIRNCAGGPTPWGSWLTCEETTNINGEFRHGYVFEVPSEGTGSGTPLKAMGRFSHEAASVDPATRIVYLTEDATPSGFYRFLPASPGNLDAGGTLQMLQIGAATVQTYGDAAPKDYGTVSWVTIPNPDPGPFPEPSVVSQGIAGGGAQFERLEGTWYGDGKIYFVATSGGPQRGQVFEYDPQTDRLRLIFSSPGNDVLDSPDNITFSPRGGMVLCEDGSGREYLHGLTLDGQIFRFAENNIVLNGERGFVGDFSGSEWAGATFEPKNGNWLFVNIQSPGITFAITGPWKQGPL
jgi:secreted PhoX family phosphatase